MPVCLNTLLYQMELDLGMIDETLGRAAEARRWRERAQARKARIETLLWDDAAGLYFYSDFERGRHQLDRAEATVLRARDLLNRYSPLSDPGQQDRHNAEDLQ